METIKETYKGYEISYVKPPLMGGMFQVNLASERLDLLRRLERQDAVIAGESMDDAIAKAKARIDEIVGGQG
jgi:hypothetical protein